MAKVQQPQKPTFREQLKVFGIAFRYALSKDRLFLPIFLASIILPLAGAIVLAVVGAGLIWLPIGFMIALIGVMLTVSIRSNKTRLKEAEGELGAALLVLQSVRGDWRIHQHVAATMQQDMVHLVIGKCGVVLIGEGDPQRVRGLIAKERRRISKIIGNTALRDIIVGNDEGQVRLNKLRITILKLPRTITGKDVNALDKRITAISARPQIPQGSIPKKMIPPKMRGSARPR